MFKVLIKKKNFNLKIHISVLTISSIYYLRIFSIRTNSKQTVRSITIKANMFLCILKQQTLALGTFQTTSNCMIFLVKVTCHANYLFLEILPIYELKLNLISSKYIVNKPSINTLINNLNARKL